jgi:uncharacterized protein YbaP (TraB family)
MSDITVRANVPKPQYALFDGTRLFSRREAVGCLGAALAALAVPRSYGVTASGFPLWEITSGRSSAYLLGHTPPQPTHWQNSRVQDLLRRCGELWNETSQTSRLPVAELIQRYGMSPEMPLHARLSAPQQAKLSAAAKAADVLEGSMAQYRPWLAGQTLEGAFFSAPGFSGRNAEKVLVTEAEQLGIPLRSEFPTLDDAVRWFVGLPPETELEYLLYIVDEILAGHAAGQQSYEAWDAGRAAPATAWLAQMQRRYPQLYRSMVVERNQRWVARFRSMLGQDRPTLVVVGFYHLVGADSMQAQLAAQGLTVRRS